MAKTSILQTSDANLLTISEPSLQDTLAELGRDPRTIVNHVGDQRGLFDESVTPMVEVINGSKRLLVSQEEAAKFGLRVSNLVTMHPKRTQ